MDETTKKLNLKRAIIFVVITFIITYGIEIFVIRPMILSGDPMQAAIGQTLIAAIMFIPAIGVLLTRLITKEGFKDSSMIVPKTGKKSIPYFLMGYFGPALLIFLGAALYFLIYPEQFDGSMSYMASVYSAQGVEMTPALLQATAYSQIIMGVLIGPILNCITCFGEEWGWRGYLLPKMKGQLPLLPMLLVNGIIWGLWHAPITALGHNYGMGYWGFPFTGILAMCCFCIVIGTLFSYLTIRTGSCLPAVLAHGGLNSMAAAATFYTATTYNPFVGPAPTGFIGGAAFIVAAIVVTILLLKKSNANN